MFKEYFIAASILCLNSELFASDPCPAAYNLPASICVNNECSCLPDLFFNASYLYWLAGEDGLELGRSGGFVFGDDPFFTPVTTLLSQPFEYQSGFKVGAGWRQDDWVLSGEYTWIRNTISQNSSAPNSGSDILTGVWLIAPWFLQQAGDGGSLSGTQISSKWHLRMDLADLSLSYPYYQGCRLTMTPFGGLRAAWISQKMGVSLFEPLGVVSALPPQPIHSLTGSNSWAIGPRFGTIAHGLLDYGFRIEGDLALSLLATQYTKIYHKEDDASVGAVPGNLHARITNKNTLRPVLECGLGLGWGSYLCANRYYIDFSADYDFMLWWNQNVMREMLNFFWTEVPANGDLYLHGLTLSGRFDF